MAMAIPDLGFQLQTAMTQSLPPQASGAADEAASTRRAAEQFEGLLTQMMLKSMRATSFGDDLTGAQGGHWQDLFDQELSKEMSRGKGLGLADVLVRQLGGPAEAVLPQSSPAGYAMPSLRASPVMSARSLAAAESAAPSSSLRERAQAFVQRLKPYAERAAETLGVPARALLAQAALETGWGAHLPQSADGTSSMNLFGIKANRSWGGKSVNTDTQEFVDGSMRSERASFRAYDSIADAFNDYVGFLQDNPRYRQALRDGAAGVAAFARGLQDAGYATDPQYASKLSRIASSRLMDQAWHATTAAATPKEM